jgi:hypothetical protein
VSRNFVAGEAKIARSETAPESLQEKNRGRTESGIPISSVLGPAPVKPDWSLVCWPQKAQKTQKFCRGSFLRSLRLFAANFRTESPSPARLI